MIVYLLLSILFGLIVLASIVTVIVGFVKKRKNIIVTAAILFTAGVVGGVYSIVTYTKKAFQYVTSDEFQKDAQKGSEMVGETIGSVSSGMSKGLSSTLDDEAIAALANKSATIIGKSVKTIASGLDSTIGNTNIFVDTTLSDAGFELGRAEEIYQSHVGKLEIFIDYKKDFKGKLRIANYDQAGKKIDIAETNISAKAGDGRVEVFNFPHSTMGVTTYYIISKVE